MSKHKTILLEAAYNYDAETFTISWKNLKFSTFNRLWNFYSDIYTELQIIPTIDYYWQNPLFKRKRNRNESNRTDK